MEISLNGIKERLLQKHLVPFYALFSVYYITYQPFWSHPPVTLTAALFKALPVWALAAYVRLSSGDDQITKLSPQTILPEQDYHKFLMLGLFFSSLGDAALIARDTLFIPGMLLFSIAHVFYLYAIGPGSDSSRLRSLFILGSIGTFLFMESEIEELLMKTLVLIYCGLIFTVGWRATSKFERERTYPALFGCLGILLFLFSDFVIGVNKWKCYIPFNELIIMTTYYAGQLGIALSADRK